jgi:ABC-type transport system involved in multi-copper enzyme maturation permease subunit
LRSPKNQPGAWSAFGILFLKEWRSIASGRAFWVLLLLLCPLVGYSYTQALALYAEASRSAGQLPEVARNLSPLDGILVPTFGALYLANTFLFPFVAIRSVAHEKETGSLKLLLQLPPRLGAVLSAKVAALAGAWVVVAGLPITTVALWALAGGHVAAPELANLLLGHWLYGAVVIGFALIAAALAESSATAAILVLAITLGSWVLEFAAAGASGMLKSLANVSLSALLRTFERGIFSLGSVLGASVAAVGLVVAAGILMDLKRTSTRKLATAVATLVGTALIIAGAAQLHVYADASEDRRNSLAPADAETLSGLKQRLTVVVRLAPEDPRYIDFERNILGKLERTMPDVKIVLQSQSRTGALEEGSEKYGTILYQYAGRQAESRSTGAGEILPIIYGLAQVERKSTAPAPPYPGYPLEAGTRAAEACFYAILPLLIVTAWITAQGQIRLPRSASGRAAETLPSAKPRANGDTT